MKSVIGIVAVLAIVSFAIGSYWSIEPDAFSVKENAKQKAEALQVEVVPGFTTSATLSTVANTLLNKSGGYLSNDLMIPGVLLDNIPSWEFGVLVQVRDLSRAMRKSFSRSQSQSVEDKLLAKAEPKFSFDNKSFILPSTESKYEEGVQLLNNYIEKLADPSKPDAQFYTRADNLNDWLRDVESRLGSLSQRLSASVGKERLNLDLAGDPDAERATYQQSEQYDKTPWLEIDNVFYEARGAAWALIHFLKAVEVDFAGVLNKKNALISLKQIIRELEATQETVWSPMVLNGGGFGFWANHSLVMASYISRANAAIIDLRKLLQKG
ncbi:DUF2333 family protein [Spartinivicinus sp. A2-2]|uniref:DUF2333 family protein n=2 Tax=Spartinivicinus poritis TaxID=2994640 RepID=A0ABT5U4F4_9GAMM|nr:DUF2333 family protein [Spartinivicinus sp. A2-2]MDE1461241.1 DUF2333 family protein [Spartinivicinus sp. A2-2]